MAQEAEALGQPLAAEAGQARERQALEGEEGERVHGCWPGEEEGEQVHGRSCRQASAGSTVWALARREVCLRSSRGQ